MACLLVHKHRLKQDAPPHQNAERTTAPLHPQSLARAMGSAASSIAGVFGLSGEQAQNKCSSSPSTWSTWLKTPTGGAAPRFWISSAAGASARAAPSPYDLAQPRKRSLIDQKCMHAICRR